MTDFDLNRTWVSFTCPSCNYTDDVQLVDVRSEKTIFCHNCKSSIQLVDSDAAVHKGVHDINDAMIDILNTFKKLGR
jgi:transcription elongation factor Elf1